MSIIEKLNKAMDDKDEAALREIMHDDYAFTMHKTGNVPVSYTHLTLPTKRIV